MPSHGAGPGRRGRWRRPAAATATAAPAEAPPQPPTSRQPQRSPSLLVSPQGRDFRRLWAGDTISQLGTQVGFIALPLLAVTVLAADEFQMGLLATFETLAFLLIGLPAGAWGDRRRERSVVIGGGLVRTGWRAARS